MVKTAGERFELIRKRKLGMSQQQVAEVVGVTASSISKFETNKLHELGHRMELLAALAGVTVEFLEGKDDPDRVKVLCPLYVETLSLPQNDYDEVLTDLKKALDRVHQRHRNERNMQ